LEDDPQGGRLEGLNQIRWYNQQDLDPSGLLRCDLQLGRNLTARWGTADTGAGCQVI